MVPRPAVVEGDMPQRPTSVTVLCIITALLGCAGLGCIPLSVVGNLTNRDNPVYFVIEDSAFLRIWIIASGILGVISIFVALAGVGGAWTLRPWGRAVLMGYSIYSIVMAVVSSAVNVVFMLVPFMSQMDMSTDE